MAESLFKPPGELNIVEGNVSENFKKWKRQIEVYLAASGATDKGGETQTAIILHCAGPKVIEIYDQINWPEGVDKNDPKKVLEKLHDYCNPRQNEVLESHRFWSVKLEEHSSFEHFLTELRNRVESCNFKEKDRMLRDKIVFSASGKLQELLLREDKLDLEKAIKRSRAYEQSNKHVREIRENKSETPIHKVEAAHTTDRKQEYRSNQKKYVGGARQRQSLPSKLKKECSFCGYLHELKKEKCPAWGKTCDACNGRNHFKKMCKKVNSVEQCDTEDDEDEFWLSVVRAEKRSTVTATMTVNNCDVKFQVDTGAEINTINSRYVRKTQVKRKDTKLRLW